MHEVTLEMFVFEFEWIYIPREALGISERRYSIKGIVRDDEE